ncbi:sialate O-acetylesterase [Flavobacterium nitrogenifigens]|uniref:Sialate O-acetylesterase n=2 Tax=Flavobacterium TaxID=237 RepID=A0A7W7IXW3_9FLAO|nr:MULTISPECIES: sialate O-acetylesterase [Flavobacterium]MBB4802631.1 sialate O-acetylesterase [Flavobacterium nitrogenifigens]MBB6387589.1 sialate O-acetylesterase [Flavobacterium notoginsengisoli]
MHFNKSNFSLLGLLLLCSLNLFSQITLPKILGHNMVLQQNKEVSIWGTASAGEKISVDFAGQNKTTVADQSGKWSLKLKPMKASFTPREMTIKGKNTIVLKNILIGEVWLCSGQSNMEYAMRKYSKFETATKGYKPPEDDLNKANNTNIRIFLDRRKYMDPSPEHLGWDAAMGKPLVDFSAVGYYFAKDLYAKLNVPIGMISAAVPGSRIEPWIQSSKMEITPKLKNGKTLEKLSADGGDAGKFYDTMIQPLIPYTLKGFLWYQGESNCFLNENIRYAYKFKTLIESWRNDWNDKNLPFYFVQLAPYAYSTTKDERPHSAEQLPEFWESQKLALHLKNTNTIAITDLVDSIADLHPGYKWEIGRRLSLLAVNKTYGQKNIVWSGPVYQKMKIADNTIEITFSNLGSGLASRDGKPLNWFTIAGNDGKFVNANAEIKGDKIIVSAPEILHPTAARFGWNEGAQSNFINKEGLPAVPFRTDNPWDNLFQ